VAYDYAIKNFEDIEQSARHVGREQKVDRGPKDPNLARCDLAAHREPLYLD